MGEAIKPPKLTQNDLNKWIAKLQFKLTIITKLAIHIQSMSSLEFRRKSMLKTLPNDIQSISSIHKAYDYISPPLIKSHHIVLFMIRDDLKPKKQKNKAIETNRRGQRTNLMVLLVLMRIQWGMGRFWRIFFISFFLILNVLCNGYNINKRQGLEQVRIQMIRRT